MATTRTITNAFANRVLPDIFYEDPETGRTMNIAEVEREARLAEREARLAAEAREQALLEELERLRRQSASGG